MRKSHAQCQFKTDAEAISAAGGDNRLPAARRGANVPGEARDSAVRSAIGGDQAGLERDVENTSIVGTKAAYGAYSCNATFPEKSNRADTKGVKTRFIAPAYGKFESSPLQR
jgi:hypothetical protein